MKKLFLFLVIIFAISSGNFAQDTQLKSTGFIPDILTEMEYVRGQVMQLMEAMPEEKYSWRPSEGVRSVSEVYMHLAEANYFALTFLGGSMPEGYTREMTTTVTKKAEVIDFVKNSYEHAKNIISGVSAEDLEKPVDFFGMQSNQRRVLMLVLYHSHEHLGQSVAYARTNGIVPPWSMAEN